MSNPLDRAIEAIVQVADPDRIILFGSRALGTHKEGESDYDLLILKRGVQKKRQLAQRIYMNFRNIGAPVDIIVADLISFPKYYCALNIPREGEAPAEPFRFMHNEIMELV